MNVTSNMDTRIDRLREDVVLFNRRIRMKKMGHLLTATQLQALSRLDRVGPMSARSLADLEQVTPQSIARTISTLEELDMVSRSANPSDGRATLVAITVRGSLTLDADRRKNSEWLSAVMEQNCTEAEREMLFIAGGLLRSLAELSDGNPSVESGLRS